MEIVGKAGKYVSLFKYKTYMFIVISDKAQDLSCLSGELALTRDVTVEQVCDLYKAVCAWHERRELEADSAFKDLCGEYKARYDAPGDTSTSLLLPIGVGDYTKETDADESDFLTLASGNEGQPRADALK